jgi:hypothetical protein
MIFDIKNTKTGEITKLKAKDIQEAVLLINGLYDAESCFIINESIQEFYNSIKQKKHEYVYSCERSDEPDSIVIGGIGYDEGNQRYFKTKEDAFSDRKKHQFMADKRISKFENKIINLLHKHGVNKKHSNIPVYFGLKEGGYNFEFELFL